MMKISDVSDVNFAPIYISYKPVRDRSGPVFMELGIQNLVLPNEQSVGVLACELKSISQRKPIPAYIGQGVQGRKQYVYLLAELIQRGVNLFLIGCPCVDVEGLGEILGVKSFRVQDIKCPGVDSFVVYLSQEHFSKI